MSTLVINERRREPRTAPGEAGESPQVPGARVLEVLDRSAHGLRCRLAQPVRPGRTMAIRVPAGQSGFVLRQGWVARCEVCRITRHGVQYEAAWRFDTPWRDE
ncbi:hypothetical protein TBR22_A25380 [Luteitalea sp. TBR-22]|uniref:hypothetical protein n=1 Tax=Luteitalea sp. TBR-22 TaxID=2802971 RepID=UPI001AF423AF|nr:hypothetical protein [Luteitalea sp. TBR-22]BCS33311.1 hypothetical protein TBR22_A25380 [Luteitalea sp. TBR-22]